jgi:hypothetical protein
MRIEGIRSPRMVHSIPKEIFPYNALAHCLETLSVDEHESCGGLKSPALTTNSEDITSLSKEEQSSFVQDSLRF